MIARSPTVWYADVTIDVGCGDGVAVDDPVVNGDGLVGTVSAVTGGSAQVTLIADRLQRRLGQGRAASASRA